MSGPISESGAEKFSAGTVLELHPPDMTGNIANSNILPAHIQIFRTLRN